MTSPIVKDPLLTAARVLLIVLTAILGFALLMVSIGLPALLIFQDRVVAEMVAEGVVRAEGMVPLLACILAGVIVLLSLGVWFLVLLYRMVMSVGAGDPFAPANADRLARMGWIAIAGQLVAWALEIAGAWLGERVPDTVEGVRVGGEVGVEPTGLLLILTLFILARVFRHGAAMRADLEGTV